MNYFKKCIEKYKHQCIIKTEIKNKLKIQSVLNVQI